MEKNCKLRTPTRKMVATKSQDTKQNKYWKEREEK